MNKAVASAVVVWVIALLAAGSVSAQSDDSIQILSVDTSAEPVVELVAAIPPSFGEVPANASFFGLTESGERRTISVEPLRDSVDVVLVIDTSGSMRGEAIQQAKAAAVGFVRELPEGARIAVVGFGASPSLASPLGASADEHEAAIQSLSATGETALWDALVLASDTLAASQADQPYIVVLSDGGDTVSTANRETATAAMLESGSPLYAVVLDTAETAESELVESVNTVGGEFLTTSESSELAALYTEIAGRLTSRYLVRFEAGGSGETSAILSVAVDDRIAIARTDLSLAESEQAAAPATLESAAVPAELGSVLVPQPSGLSQGWVLWVGAIASFGALALIIGNFSLPAVQVRGLGSAKAETVDRVAGIREGLSRSADRVVQERDEEGSFDLSLDSAGMSVRPGEFLVITFASMIAAGLFGSITGGAAGGVGLALLAGVVAYALVTVRASRRRDAFADQLPESISIMIGSLRSGRGMPQALELVAQETQKPMSEEFRRVVVESRIGRDQVQALEAVARRMKNDDIDWIAQAIAINREIGGDLVEVLENVAETIRSRTRVHRQVRALSAEGRLSGWFMVSMPFIMFAYMRAVNPRYIAPLTSTTSGLAAIAVGLILIAMGGVWIRKLIDLKY